MNLKIYIQNMCSMIEDGPRVDLTSENIKPIPYELLLKIFKYTVESSYNTIVDLCNLLRVCKLWRDIVLRTPTLWTRIAISYLRITETNINLFKQILETCPAIFEHIHEVVYDFEEEYHSAFLGTLLSATFLQKLSFDSVIFFRPGYMIGLIMKCKRLRSLNIVASSSLLSSQNWLANYLLGSGFLLETLDLHSSLRTISNKLSNSICSHRHSRLKVLNLSANSNVREHSLDAVELAMNMPNLEILSATNVIFERVYRVPYVKGLINLKELSISIYTRRIRDADRNDELLATLAYGSDKITKLDILRSSFSPDGLLNMPSNNVRELHMDDMCPNSRKDYHLVIKKWSHSLEVLSLERIRCSDTIISCLNALSESRELRLRELNLTQSDVEPSVIRDFIDVANSLEYIDLTQSGSFSQRLNKTKYAKKQTDEKSGIGTFEELKSEISAHYE